MQSLQLDIAHLAEGDFSVLPSPSTLFAGTSGNPVVDYTLPSPSTAAFEYQAAFSAYSGHPHAAPTSVESTPEPPAWFSDSSHASSPASSFHSSPRGSPLLDKAVVVIADDQASALDPYERAIPEEAASDHLIGKGEPDLASEPLSQHPLVPGGAALQLATCASFPHGVDRTIDTANIDPMGAYAAAQQPDDPRAPQQHFAAPSLAPNACLAYNQEYFDASAYHLQQAYMSPPPAYAAAHAGFSSAQFAVDSGEISVAQSQQQGFVPLQFTTISGATYAVAVPVSAPVPAAIETPHGTYYFVPNPAPLPVVTAQSAELQQQKLEQTSPAPAPVVPAPIPVVANQEPAFVLSTGATVPASALPSAMAPQQKIRLPVGQGKRGSTKRLVKKDQPKRFVCPHPGCGRAFARNFNMSSHYKSHLGVREFACHVCPKLFSRRHDRARHCAAVHDEHVDRDGNVAGAGFGAAEEHELDVSDESVASFDPYAVDVHVGAASSG
ncbi:hypothetical protein JCM3770_001447 [Rhodotorula araucariae]